MKCTFTLLTSLLFWFPLSAGDDNVLKLSTAEKKMLDLTNAERKKRDLPLLTPSPLLFKVARDHAQNMARQGKLEHVLDGKNPVQRLRDAGYPFATMAENIAWIDERIPLENIMRDWMGSQVHRDNILGKDVTEIGLGLARNSKGQIYCSQEFGRPR